MLVIEDVHSFIKKVSEKINIENTWFQLVIINIDSCMIIGAIGIHFINGEQAEIGYTIDKEQQCKGYATEALKATINFLFTDLNKHRIIGSIDPLNIKSIGLIEKLGFRKEAHFKKSIMINGEWVDDLIYAILKDEWIENRKQTI